jgi:hypothetical protein
MSGVAEAAWDTPAVWIDEEGVAHTAALPVPTQVMTEDFRTSLDAVASSNLTALRMEVERAEVRAYDTDWSELRGSEIHVGAPAPSGLLRGHVATPEAVADAIDAVVPRWRLDVIVALDDYLA